LIYLNEEHNIRICKKTLQNFLKGTGHIWKGIRPSLKSNRNQDEFDRKQQIKSLKELVDSGYIDLYLGDKSHFGLAPNVPYAAQTKEKPIELPAPKGKFHSVVGFMNRQNHLFFEVCETTLY